MNKRHNQKNDLDSGTPYWKNAHTDWRFQVAVGLMLIAIAVYVLSGDLTWLPHF